MKKRDLTMEPRVVDDHGRVFFSPTKSHGLRSDKRATSVCTATVVQPQHATRRISSIEYASQTRSTTSDDHFAQQHCRTFFSVAKHYVSVPAEFSLPNLLL